ncbi:cache domain-containing protein [bacterium]|nr:cache domain-containing protein [bacterium]
MQVIIAVRTLIVVLAIPLIWSAPVRADDRGTRQEARAMAEAAAALYRAQGPEAAFEAFNHSPEFHDRDLYVFALDSEGILVAHGTGESLIGRDLSRLRDPSGRSFVQEFLAIEDTGWIEYQWTNPATGNVEDKVSFLINVGDHVIGVGAYRE